MKLTLGSAQFGLNYGIANSSGIPNKKELQTILKTANAAGIETIDTAIAYGDSEKNLGEQNLSEFDLITKISQLPEKNSELWCIEQCTLSIQRLKIKSLYALLLHNPKQLTSTHSTKVINALNKVKELGLVRKVGISIYSPEELDAIYPIWKPEIIQAPFNALDQRLKTTGWLAQLKSDGVEVHTRSIFLQGLLLQTKQQMVKLFPEHNLLWQSWHEWLQKSGLSPLQANLAVALNEDKIDKLVIGVDNIHQLKEIIESATTLADKKLKSIDFSCDDISLINPSRWKKQ